MPGSLIPAYTLTARILHWITVVLIAFMVPAGIYMANFEDGELYDFIYSLHKSTGFLILIIVVIRLIYRLTHPPLALPADIPAAQRAIAETIHWALYGLLIVQPIVGWIATSAYPAPLPFFGLFEMPPVWSKDTALAEKLYMVHRILGITIAVLAAGHAAAALQHHFIRKDRVLMRMITGE